MKFGRSRSGSRNSIDRFLAFIESLRPGDRFIYSIVALTLFFGCIWLAVVASTDSDVAVPAHGGTLVEGVVGTPRFINPVLAVTRADRDLTAVVYAGLTRLNSAGTIEPDIADSITMSDDGLVYNVVVRRDVRFHDGTPLTAHDVAFTISQIQNPILASPLRASWEGVTVEVLGDYELNFVLSEAYAPFVENLTVGILPRHIWAEASGEEFPFSQYNSEPIGAGPYAIHRSVRNASGIPESYTLESYTDYHGETPRISTLTLKFYTNENSLIQAFNNDNIDSVAGLSPQSVARLNLSEKSHTIHTTPLPRTFAVFFNQNKSAALRDVSARRALEASIDRTALIERVLDGYGEPLTSPIPPGFNVTLTTPANTPAASSLDTGRELLRNGGWTVNTETGIWEKEIDDVTTPLAFSIATANDEVFEETAQFIQEQWRQLGVDVTVKQFEQSDLTQAIIRPRDYDALLFGTVLGRALDLYSFWHSSQRNDPGLNIALYANITADSALNTARTTASSTVRTDSFQTFADEVRTEVPAVFLYSPELIYILPRTVTGVELTGVADVHERFTNSASWYIDTDTIWPIFTE